MLPPTWRPQVRQISGQNSEISGNDARALRSSTTSPRAFGLRVGIDSAGLIAWAWLVGIYAIVYGVLYIVTGFRLKSLQPSQTAATH